MKILNDVMPEWLTGEGIFSALQDFNVPWKDDNIASILDMEYHGNVSGEKPVSPLVLKMTEETYTLTTTQINTLASIIFALNGVNWGKLWDTLSFEYDPISNYDMKERMTNDQTITQYGKTNRRVEDLQHDKTGTETDTPDITDLRTDNLTHAKTGTDRFIPNTTEMRTDNLQHTKTGTETAGINKTDTRTDNLQHTKTGTETSTPNTTETTTPNLQNTSDTGIYGFNSAAASGSGTTSTTATGTNTVRKSGTDTTTYNLTEAETGTQANVTTGTNTTTYDTAEADTGTQTTQKTGSDSTEYGTSETDTGTQTNRRSGTDTRTYNTTDTDDNIITDTEGGSDSHTRNYFLTRTGNIGVTTSQQMIQSERDLWKWNYFRDVVFPDIDKSLCLLVY